MDDRSQIDNTIKVIQFLLSTGAEYTRTCDETEGLCVSFTTSCVARPCLGVPGFEGCKDVIRPLINKAGHQISLFDGTDHCHNLI